MTERESKEFYDDLRRKLEDYGSAPPESVWAGIRQQVPTRRRRWWRGALLVLLLVGTVAYFTVSTRPWRPRSESQPVAATTTSASSGASVGASASTPRSAAATGRQDSSSEALRPNQPAALATASTETQRRVPTKLGTSELTGNRLSRGGNVAFGTETIRPKPPTSDSTTETYTRRAAVAPTTTESAPAVGTARKRRALRVSIPLAVAATRRQYPLRPKPTDFPSETASPAPIPEAASLAQEAVKPTALTPGSAAPKISGATLTEPTATLAAGNLLPLWVRLQFSALPIPKPAYAPVAASRQQQLNTPKWAVQVLAGPTVSYRKLGPTARRVEQLERPAAGYNGQLGVARTLTPRLALSVGVGYTEMAASLYLRLQKADSVPLVTTRLRDYYRLLTVPVEAHYLLGNTTRWRYGVQGGMAPALLLSARTTEGGTCNCQQQQWQPASDSTRFRQLNLTLTASAFVGYQAAPGLWLTLRPQAQYFLNSITEPISGRAARQPWSIGVQGGISFDLPFKP
jgi:hypothetical protein